MMQLPFCFAAGVSGDGRVVVGVSNPTRQLGQDRACIWTGGAAPTMEWLLTREYGLDLSGWVLTAATGVSADGHTIVGYGINPSGNWEAWVATIPEPGTLALLALGAWAFVGRRARRNWYAKRVAGFVIHV